MSMSPITTLSKIFGVAFLSLSSKATALSSGNTSCFTQSQPNPIVSLYPHDLTGNTNGTFSILPISLETARSFVPEEFPILVDGYSRWLPGWAEKGLYPVSHGVE